MTDDYEDVGQNRSPSPLPIADFTMSACAAYSHTTFAPAASEDPHPIYETVDNNQPVQSLTSEYEIAHQPTRN